MMRRLSLLRKNNMSNQERMTSEQYQQSVRKQNKYHAQAQTVDGIRFDSKKEAQRYRELKLSERAGVISGLRWQVPFRLEINGHHITTYKADFVYDEQGKQVVEDTKGMRTRVFLMKKKMMKAQYGIEIKEL
jgi:hypothetical protein